MKSFKFKVSSLKLISTHIFLQKRVEIATASPRNDREGSSPSSQPADKPTSRRINRLLTPYSLLLTAILLTVLLAGCGERKSTEERSVEDAVKLYNRTLIESYRRVNPELMEYITTPKESGRVSMFMLFNLTDKKQTMESELLNIEIDKIDFDSKKRTARVRTKEYWTFYYRSSETREKASDKQAVEYRSNYRLIKAQNRWVVDELRVKVTKGPEPVGSEEAK